MKVGKYSLACSLPPAGSEKCFLFLHGLQSRKELFDGLREALREDFDLPHLAFDYPGFGESDKPEDFSYDLGEQTDMVIQLLRQIGIKKTHVIGHSRGGMIGTLMMEKAPTMMLSLVSMEGNLCLEDCSESRKVAAVDYETFKTSFYPDLKRRTGNSNEPNAVFRQRTMAMTPDYAFYRTAKSIVEWAGTNVLKQIFEGSSLPRILICGKKSSFKSRPQGKNAFLAEINDGGHFMILDNPTDTIAAIKHFLNKQIA